jgi:hypothetical protein
MYYLMKLPILAVVVVGVGGLCLGVAAVLTRFAESQKRYWDGQQEAVVARLRGRDFSSLRECALGMISNKGHYARLVEGMRDSSWVADVEIRLDQGADRTCLPRVLLDLEPVAVAIDDHLVTLTLARGPAAAAIYVFDSQMERRIDKTGMERLSDGVWIDTRRRACPVSEYKPHPDGRVNAIREEGARRQGKWEE